MSRNFLTGIQLNGNVLQGATVESLASAPPGAVAGRVYYSSSVNALLVLNAAGQWVPTDPSLVPNNWIPFSKVAGIQAAINATPLSSFAAPLANIPMGGYTFTGIPAAAAAGQPMEYSQVLGLIQTAQAGLSAKGPVITVYTTNVSALSGAAPTNDGVSPAAGSRVLLTGQTTASQNGVWITGSGPWTRPTTDGNSELETGATWLVDQGTTYLRTQWTVQTTGTITPGTTAVSIVQFNAASIYTSGNSISIVGNVVAVTVAACGGVLSASGGLSVDPTVVARKYSATIGDGSTTTYTVTHNLNNMDVIARAYLVSTGGDVEVDVNRISGNPNAISIGFGLAPASNTIRVVVMG